VICCATEAKQDAKTIAVNKYFMMHCLFNKIQANLLSFDG
jgi:hypothetical protein